MEIRFAELSDAGALLDIYRQYIETPITFECGLPTEEEFAGRIGEISAEYPYLVCVDEGKIIGYAYAHRQMQRAAYRWNAELSVYLDGAYVSRGLGRKMYGMLIGILKLQEVRNVYGVVTTPNERSEKLHETMGFRKIGIHHNTGYKSGQWRDVAWFEKSIGGYPPHPPEFRSIKDLDDRKIQDILNEKKIL